MNNENGSESKPLEDLENNTKIDLGEGLLAEKTVVLQRNALQETPIASSENSSVKIGVDIAVDIKEEGLDSLLQSAKILIGEGLITDAKKVLRQVLINHPTNALALQTLKEIQGLELNQIFRGEEIKRPGKKKDDSSWAEVDAEALMRQLDQDLGLGVFQDEVASTEESQESLFSDPEVMKTYCTQVERSLASGSVRDWIDMGVAFLEMDLYLIAARILTGACRRLDSEAPNAGEQALSATSLLALALILAGRPFEAVSRIQPILQDVEIKRENKIEPFYLMGRVYELTQKFGLAVQFYQQVCEINAHYRDVDQRLRRCQRGTR